MIALNIISVSNIISMEPSHTFQLDTYRCRSASVTPVYTHKNKLCVIPTREAEGKDQKKGGKKYTYDDFSGGSEKGETNPLKTAAREFYEEAMIPKTLGLSLEETERFIKENTHYVIVYTKDKSAHNPKSREVRNVTYIVNFDTYADKLFANFYDARKSEKEYYKKLGTRKRHQHTTEKDRIASIFWDDLKEASISNQKIIWAAVKNPQTNRFEKKQITLRPFFSSKLRPFFLNMPYEQGENDTIRHYHARVKKVYTFPSDECSYSSSEEI